MKDREIIRKVDPKKPVLRTRAVSAQPARKTKALNVTQDDLHKLLGIVGKLKEFVERRNDPGEIEQARIKRETVERGTYQPGVGWTYMSHFVPVVSEEWSRKYERRKEIIRKGTWNSSRKGWEYDGDFAGIWD